jgi:membrane fusion protein, multidrug efflux system
MKRFFPSLLPSFLPALALGAVLAPAGCGPSAAGAVRQAADPAPPAKVEPLVVGEQPMPRTLRLAGTLIASEESAVAAGVAGKVLATYVERGSYVKKGTPLVKLDARMATAAADEAAAQLASSRVQRDWARAECERNQSMFDKGAISRVDYDRGQAACGGAQHTESAAAARTVSTRTTLADSTIRAPFSGVVSERTASPGEYVRADSTVVTLVAVDPLRLELTVPEAHVAEVRPDMTLTFRTAAEGEPGAAQRAVVRYVGPSVRRQSRDLVVEAVVQNPDRKLRPGMFVVASLALGSAPAAVVPRAAVRSEGPVHRVFVIAGDGLEERLVQLGEERDGLVAVVSGVAAGERVVARATPELRDGLRVASVSSR